MEQARPEKLILSVGKELCGGFQVQLPVVFRFVRNIKVLARDE
jgi:hypothetical protein